MGKQQPSLPSFLKLVVFHLTVITDYFFPAIQCTITVISIDATKWGQTQLIFAVTPFILTLELV